MPGSMSIGTYAQDTSRSAVHRRPRNFRFFFSLNRFFHDGVRLQAGRVAAALSQIRALVRILGHGSLPTPSGNGRENDGANIASQRRRSRSSGRPRSARQQRSGRQHRSTPDQLFSQMLPATILLAYDSCSTTGCHESDRRPGAQEDEARWPANGQADRPTRNGQGSSPPPRRRRESVLRSSPSRTAGEGPRRAEQGEAGGEERGRGGVQLRVVEFVRAGAKGGQREQDICRGFEQVGGTSHGARHSIPFSASA